MLRAIFVLASFIIFTFGESSASENRKDLISYDGKWNLHFALDTPDHICSQLLKPSFLTIKSGNISGNIPFSIGSFDINAKVGDLIIGIFDDDFSGEVLTIEATFKGDRASGRFSQTNTGCEGPIELIKENTGAPNTTENLSIKNKLLLLKELLSKNLITEEEAKDRRQKILEGI